MNDVYAYIDAHASEYIELLQKLCRQPSVSAQNYGMREMADLLVEELEKTGVNTTVYETGGNPILYGELGGENKGRTISFYNHYLFACVSFLRAKKKAELPPHFLTVTFGLGHPKTADRIAVCTEAARHRWTHHVVVGSVAEIDDELIEWLKEAYDFSNSK